MGINIYFIAVVFHKRKYIFFIMCFLLLLNTEMCEGRSLNSTKEKSIETNAIQRHSDTVQRNNESNRSLKRVFLSNRTVVCNDGSQAGFYLRKSTNSKKWVVFLEGGWHCYDVNSCRARWLKLRHLMTSAQWPETKDVGGILSPLEADNPYWYDANHVLIPYCSSDSWSGTNAGSTENSGGWRFMGSLIIQQTIADLIPLGLGKSGPSELLLVGSSAGGLGVMINIDRVNKFLRQEKKLKVQVRGVSDSGWFLDREPYTPSAIGVTDAVRQGWNLWKGLLPDRCVKHHKVEPWRCYFGYRIYPHLKSPVFVFQWLFDEAQMRADNVGAPVTPQQWNYIHDMGGALKTSLDNVTAVFAPSCIGHAVLSKRDWINIKIDDISLPEALRCWESFTKRKRNKSEKQIKNQGRGKNNNSKANPNDKFKKKTRRRHKKHGLSTQITRKERNHSQLHCASTSCVDFGSRHKNSTKNRHTTRREIPLKCSLRLLERCSWPQCNHSCPSLTNPVTGEEMRFLELLTSFGLDIGTVATALGVDMQTLNNMDRTELVNLLTQRVS